MKKKPLHPDSEKSLTADIFVFILFITGASPHSTTAIINLKNICDKYLKGRYKYQVVDVYQQPTIAKDEQLVALPLLIKKAPLPERRCIGDLSDTRKVLQMLGIYAES
ncbi:circadian clock KaiB family protein [Pollutibacter soli]|uniref:circadian clock KaiB family protein n=1 Tax=Pollutibacter soli TaxID=3034157 RepID=UPI003013280C